MRFVYLIVVMGRLGMLTPLGLWRLLAAIVRCGAGLKALLRIAERTYGDRPALTDDRETIGFRQLLSDSERLAEGLRRQFGLSGGQKAAFLCSNHASLVKSLFAASFLGADLYLLNADMSDGQLREWAAELNPDLLIYDAGRTAVAEPGVRAAAKLPVSAEDGTMSVEKLIRGSETGGRSRLVRLRPKFKPGRIMLQTGGTTGKAKQAPHRPSLFHYLPPLAAMLRRMPLNRCRTSYIATPIYHGYGIAILLLNVALGVRTVLTARFEADKACRLIEEHQVDFASVVPLMIDRMVKHRAGSLNSLACVASGGAELSPRLAEAVEGRLGRVLYNLYGTSEAGLCTIATPEQLREAPGTIGSVIEGVKLHLLDERGREVRDGEVGELCVMAGRSHDGARWIRSGDFGFRDRRGHYFLCGRLDDRIVSGGENVYPYELERLLLQHPQVEDAAAFGIPDEAFGQRLKAVVQPADGAELTVKELREWLRPRAARFQMPKEIVFAERIDYTALGKRDKKRMTAEHAGKGDA